MGARLLALAFSMWLVACGESDVTDAERPLVVPKAPDAPFVTYLASFKSGVGAVAALVDGRAVELFPASSDVLLRRARERGAFYVLDRRNGVLYRHDLTSTRLERAFYRDRGANFQDVHDLPDGSRWVSALNREAIVRLDAAGRVVESVSLKSLAAPEAKGLAYPTYFWSSKGRTFLMVQRLKDGVRPSNASYVVELAAEKGIVGKPRKLAATNPYTDWVPASDKCAYIGEAGEIGMFSALDGAIERFCPDDAEPWSVVATEKELRRDLYDFVALDERRLLLLSTSPKNEIFTFSLELRSVDALIERVEGFRFVDLEQTTDGVVYVADRDEKRPGIRRVDVLRREILPPMPTNLEPLSILPMQ